MAPDPDPGASSMTNRTAGAATPASSSSLAGRIAMARGRSDEAPARIDVKVDDGWKGWPEKGPYDRVLLTAAAQQVPRTLLAQLSDGGFLLGPVVRADGKQEIVRLIRRGGKVEIERLIECTFVPLVRQAQRKPRTKVAGSGASGARS